MKYLLLLATLAAPSLATADGFVIGAGRWNCGDVVAADAPDKSAERLQIAGWIFGYWSAATFARETAFIDTVENVGGNAILDATLAECQKAAPETPLFRIVQQMITNTN